ASRGLAALAVEPPRTDEDRRAGREEERAAHGAERAQGLGLDELEAEVEEEEGPADAVDEREDALALAEALGAGGVFIGLRGGAGRGQLAAAGGLSFLGGHVSLRG